jgi:hypothetical protein
MWCPTCGAEYRGGFTHCPDCNVALISELPEPPVARSGPGANIVTVHKAANPQIAELIKGLLASEGIPCSLAVGGVLEAYPVTVGPLAEVGIAVREEDRDRAKEIIAAAERGEFQAE